MAGKGGTVTGLVIIMIATVGGFVALGTIYWSWWDVPSVVISIPVTIHYGLFRICGDVVSSTHVGQCQNSGDIEETKGYLKATRGCQIVGAIIGAIAALLAIVHTRMSNKNGVIATVVLSILAACLLSAACGIYSAGFDDDVVLSGRHVSTLGASFYINAVAAGLFVVGAVVIGASYSNTPPQTTGGRVLSGASNPAATVTMQNHYGQQATAQPVYAIQMGQVQYPSPYGPQTKPVQMGQVQYPPPYGPQPTPPNSNTTSEPGVHKNLYLSMSP